MLKKVATITSGISFRRALNNDPQGKYRVVSLGDIALGEDVDFEALPKVVIDKGVSKEHLVRSGDILLKAKGDSPVAVCLTNPPTNLIAAAGIMIIRRRGDVSPRDFNPQYVAWYINQRAIQRHLRALAAGTMLLSLRKTEVEGLPIKLPPAQVQRCIAELDRLRRREVQLLNRLTGLREKLTNQIMLDSLG